MSFYQSEDRQVKGTRGKLHANVVCCKCKLKGHYQSWCPFIDEVKEEETEEECHLHLDESEYIIISDSEDDMCYFQAICLMLKQVKHIDLHWQIILDTGSSASVFHNSDLLKKIWKTTKPLRLITNRGELKANWMGMFHDLRVWHSTKSIANILSFSSVASKHRIVIDMAKEKDIRVEIGDRKWVNFEKNNLGLYVHDMRRGFSTYSDNDTKYTLTPYSFLQTVSNNAEFFTS